MLQVDVPGRELWDAKNEVFINTKPVHLTLEHSLVSIAKWESTWERSFLKNGAQTKEQMEDYIRCMTLTQNVDPGIYKTLPDSVFQQVSEYIQKPMTATYFPPDERQGGMRDVVTAELIYYWMIANNIPFDPCQKWHLNRLMALIRVCSLKNAEANADPKKRRRMSSAEIMRRNAKLNEERLKKYNTTG
jgi:hypothetical protein